MYKKTFLVLVILFVSLLVFGCGEDSQVDDGAQVDEENILKIGAAVSLSGVDSRSGEIAKRGYELWMNTTNAKGGIDVDGTMYKIDIVFYDDQSDRDTVTTLVERLIIEDEVQFILAPFGSGNVFAASAITERYGVPMVSGQAAAGSIYERGFRYIFSTTADTEDYLKSSFMLAETLDPPVETVAILFENQIFCVACAGSSEGFAEDRNMEVVYFQQYESGTSDLSVPLLEIAALEPDMVVIIGWPESSAVAQIQMKELGLNFPVIVQAFGPALESWRESVGEAAMHIICEEQFFPLEESTADHIFGTAKDYADLHYETYGYTPSYDDSNSAATGVALQLAIEKAGSIDREAVRDALASLDEDTFVGRLRFKENGGRMDPRVYACQIQSTDPKDKAVFVFPLDIAEADLVYPRP